MRTLPELSKLFRRLRFEGVDGSEAANVPEGSNLGTEDGEILARVVREILQIVCSRSTLDDRARDTGMGGEMYAQSVAWRFADFVIDNIDLIQQPMSDFSGKGRGCGPFAIATELKRRTKDFARIYGVPRVRKGGRR